MTPTMTATDHERYLVEFETQERELSGGGERVRQLRRQAIDRFATLGFPTIKMEEWRFTNVAPQSDARAWWHRSR